MVNQSTILQSGYVHKLKKAWIKEYTTKDDGEQDSNSNKEKTAPNNSNPDQGNDPAPPHPGQPGSPSASSQLSSSSSSVTALHKFKKLNAFRISSNKVRSALIFLCNSVGLAIELFLLGRSELIGSLKLDNVWVFVQLIFGPHWPMSQLYKNTNIA